MELGVLLWFLGRSLGKEWLGFVRRDGTNDFWVFDVILMVSEWILLRVSCVELLYRYGKTL